jgi:hypothetical protein
MILRVIRRGRLHCLAFGVLAASAGAAVAAGCDDSAMLSSLRNARPAVMAQYWRQRERLTALKDPPATAMLVVLWGKTDPLVHDQLRHSIAAHRRTGDVYVISSGGYGGVWDVFGPFGQIAERPICAPVPAASEGSRS